jgi:hypothetical protein
VRIAMRIASKRSSIGWNRVRRGRRGSAVTLPSMPFSRRTRKIFARRRRMMSKDQKNNLLIVPTIQKRRFYEYRY